MSDRDARRGDTLIFIKEYHYEHKDYPFMPAALLYTSSWLATKTHSFADIPVGGNIGRVERSDVLRYSNDYYTYEVDGPILRSVQSRLTGCHGQTVVVHNHRSFWGHVFDASSPGFPQHTLYHTPSHASFRNGLWRAANKGYLCDVLIKGDDFQIPAHSIVLQAVPYYKVLFTTLLSEGVESRRRHYQVYPRGNAFESENNRQETNVQVLCAPPFATERVYRGFLHYVYLGRLPLEAFVSDKFALDLIMIADFYDCADLVRDAVHAVRFDDPFLALQVAESIEQTSSALLMKQRALNKMEVIVNKSQPDQ